MILIVIKIGDVKTLSVKNWLVTPDDRQTKNQTHNGISVQDFGRVVEGDKFSCTVNVRPEDAPKIYAYWNSRQLVNVTDEAGVVHENLRVVVKEYAPIPHFAAYWRLNLEFWRK